MLEALTAVTIGIVREAAALLEFLVSCTSGATEKRPAGKVTVAVPDVDAVSVTLTVPELMAKGTTASSLLARARLVSSMVSAVSVPRM
jgi:hypothetical protein